MKDKFWQKVIIGLSILFFLQILSPFSKPGVILGQDSPLHLVYLGQFEKAFKAGQFPVRLIEWIVPGLDQPVFNYYPPGVFYLFLIPRFLGLEYIASFKILMVALWLLSAILMYLLAKRYFGILAAILAAYLYLLAPYHILDILIRFALPEFAAISFIPGVFWAIKSYVDTKHGFYLTFISVFIALVTISHPPTILMFSPLIAAYLLYLVFLERPRTHIFIPLASSIIAGFGLSSFFIIPSFFEKGFVHMNVLTENKFDFHNNFVCMKELFKPYWGQGPSTGDCMNKMSFQLGLTHWFVLFSATSILATKIFIKNKKAKILKIINLDLVGKPTVSLLIICLAFIMFYILMMTRSSKLIWEYVPYISLISFPWRFLTPAIFLASFCAGFVIMVLKNEKLKYAAFILLIMATGFAYKSYLKPIEYAKPDEQIGLGNPGDAYMPRWTQVLLPEKDLPTNELKLATGEAKLNNYQLTPTIKNYFITVQKPTTARFYTHYFPGWKVIVNSQEINPKYDNTYGYMDVQLNPGDKYINLIFTNTPTRTLSNILSLSFVFLSIGLAFIFRRKDHVL